MADDDKFDNIIRAQFGKPSNKAAEEMLAQYSDVDLDVKMRIPRKEMLRLAVWLIRSIQRAMDENEADFATGMLAYGWLSACETIMTLAEQQPNIDFDERIATVRTQVAEARAIDAELIETIQEMRDLIEKDSISYDDIHGELNKMLRLITTIPGGN